MACSISLRLPWNGRPPVSSSYSSTPSAQTSVAMLTGVPPICSGAA
jgi:hypothetical protein